MNPLLMLLGQQAGVPATEAINEIVVSRDRAPAQEYQPVDYGDYSLNNEDAVLGRADDILKTEDASNRSGLFGMKGTLRDVLGIVGDAFLIQSGNKPMYAPARQQERISDAMAGFTKDPRGAAERTAYYDPATGRELYNDYETNLTKKAQAESLAASRQSLSEDRNFKRYERAQSMIGALFNTPGAVIDGRINPKAVERAAQIAASAGMTLEDFLINEGMTEEDVREFARSVITAKDQETLEDRDILLQQGQQRADATTMNAQSSRIRANRPPAGRATPNPTKASLAAEAMRIPAGQRTADQQALVDDFVGRSKGATKGPRSVPKTSRFRPVSN